MLEWQKQIQLGIRNKQIKLAEQKIGGEKMRAAKGILDRDFKDFKELADSKSEVVKALKILNNNLRVLVRLLLNLRTNQVEIGKATGAKFETLKKKEDKK